MKVIKILGVLISVLGTLGFAFAGWGLLEASDGSRNLVALMRVQRVEIDEVHWLFHWRLSILVIGAAAIALVISGAAIFLGRRWGFLTVSIAALGVAAFPWLLQVTGNVRYPFEMPSVFETSILLGGAAVAAGCYHACRSRSFAA